MRDRGIDVGDGSGERLRGDVLESVHMARGQFLREEGEVGTPIVLTTDDCALRRIGGLLAAKDLWCDDMQERNETDTGPQRSHETCIPHINGALRPPNGSRLSCGALKKDSFLNVRAPSASSAC